MSYTRVIPRDFFNEAKLLKCWGQLALKVLDCQLPEGMQIEITEDGEPFIIELDEERNGLHIANYMATINGHDVYFYSTYNSKGSYPFHCVVGDNEYDVFDEDGSFSKDFQIHNLFPKKKIEFKKINHDSNGNPRYVCHYNDLLTQQDKDAHPLTTSPIYKVNEALDARYALAIQKAKKLGGRKYSTKEFGGGIVFQSFNIHETEREIQKLLTNA